MINYNTLGNKTKEKIVNFSKNISNGMKKTTCKFIADMNYGILASKSCVLTEIARKLKENIAIKKSEERLARNLKEFTDAEYEKLTQNHIEYVKSVINNDAMLLIDPSDITKPCSPKMEAIGSVYDGSKQKFADGYWTMGIVALTPNKAQPIPVYEHLYPCKKQGGKGQNVEIEKSLQFLRDNGFDGNHTRVFDRSGDSGEIFKSFIMHNEKFIIRQNQNRKVSHKGKEMLVEDVIKHIECTHEMKFHSKTGNVSRCKIGMTTVTIKKFKNAKMSNIKMNLVVCKEWGEKPLAVYTNHDETFENIALKVVKGYLMRWRIEEFYAVKKQSLGLENFRVRSLCAIKTLNFLVASLMSFIAVSSDNVMENTHCLALVTASKRVQGTAKFLEQTKLYLYAIIDGISNVLTPLKCGIAHFFASKPRNLQLSFFPT